MWCFFRFADNDGKNPHKVDGIPIMIRYSGPKIKD